MRLSLMSILKIFKIISSILFIHYILLILISGFYKNFNSYFKKTKEGVSFYSEVPKDWVEIDKISLKLKDTIRISEDWAFFDHNGVDLRQIKQAIQDRLINKKKLRGASTITQQVIKNLFLNNQRSMFRKYNELLLTLTLELFSSKEKIFEKYLNLVQLGEKLYGLKPGSKYYFSKLPSNINYREAAFLAMLLPSPIRYSQSFRDKSLTEYGYTQTNKILNKLILAKLITEQEYEMIKQEKFSWEN